MNANPRLFSRLGYFIILIAVSLFFSANAFAQSGSLSQAVQLSKAAMEDYDNFELEDADTKLIQAVQIVENLGVTDPGVANIYIAQGIVSFGRFKDSVLSIAEDRAYTAFLKALTLNREAKIPNDYRSDELQAIFDKAKDVIVNAPKSSPVALAAVKPSVEHTPLLFNQRCAPLKIRANVPAHPDIYRTYVYYAADNQREYKSVEMKPTLEASDILEASIPPLDTRGDKVEYYIEAQDRLGQVVAYVSDSRNPMAVTMEGDCEGLSAEDKAQTYGDPLFQFSLLFGTAFGIVSGDLTNCYYSASTEQPMCSAYGVPVVSVTTGVQSLPFHMRMSAVFNLPAHFQLGLYIRAQLVNIVDKTIGTRAHVDKPWMYNLLLGVDVRYLALYRQPYRLYVGFQFGWGGANATVPLGSKYNNFKDLYLYDGPVHFAPEIGFLWTFHKNVGLAVELVIPIYFPNKPSAHFDLSVGPYFQF